MAKGISVQFQAKMHISLRADGRFLYRNFLMVKGDLISQPSQRTYATAAASQFWGTTEKFRIVSCLKNSRIGLTEMQTSTEIVTVSPALLQEPTDKQLLWRTKLTDYLRHCYYFYDNFGIEEQIYGVVVCFNFFHSSSENVTVKQYQNRHVG